MTDNEKIVQEMITNDASFERIASFIVDNAKSSLDMKMLIRLALVEECDKIMKRLS